jgi:hypothetical protein
VRLQKDWLKSTGPLSGSILRSHLDEYRNVGLGRTAKTKEDGKFSFHGVPLGKWVISARPEKSAFQAQELLQVVGDVRGLELVIPKGRGTIYGKVTEEDETLVRAWVNISGDEVSAEFKAEPDGSFQLGDLPAGQYKVSLVTFPTLYTRTVNLEAGRSTEVNFQWGPAREAPLVVEFDLTSLLNDKLQSEDIVCWATLHLSDLRDPGREVTKGAIYFRGASARERLTLPAGAFSCVTTLHLVPPGRPDKFWPRGRHLSDVRTLVSSPVVTEIRENSETTVRFAHFE